jgi:hypothetical protein
VDQRGRTVGETAERSGMGEVSRYPFDAALVRLRSSSERTNVTAVGRERREESSADEAGAARDGDW